MSIIAFLIILALEGLVVGALARLALPGPDPMSVGQTILLGIAGSFVAGLIGLFLLGHGAGLLLSIIVTTGILYFIRRSRGGSLTRPAPRAHRF
jgi:uncharacterized membrane protein YeaQ/YmgE (transglycosylase-associated protein family)